MPAHIYSMVGLWEDSIASNLSALEIQPDYYHAADFTVYAHLQLSQDREAARLIAKALATPSRGDRPSGIADFTAKAAMPARYALERADWAAAAALVVTPTPVPQADAVTRFTRALGLARTGNPVGARAEISELRVLKAALDRAGDGYWAARVEDQILAASAWVALAGGARAEAVDLMTRAADAEDGSIKHVAMENRLYPMRELLGDLLLEAGHPDRALVEYTKSLQQYPNRYRGLYGAARAAEAAGDAARAAEYYGKLVTLAGKADAPRPETARAAAFAKSR
jgi:tetratricopeptide (TPR) repeat protein